jgi:hypothetical protein
MKLFITNKYEMETVFDDLDSKTFSSKLIHSSAYNELLKSIDVDNCIPLTLTPDYDDFGVVILDFMTKKNDIYYYKFNGTAK